MLDLEQLERGLERTAARRALPKPADRARLRRAADLTQLDVARALGISGGHVAHLEDGRRSPSPELAVHYLKLLRRLAEETGLTRLLDEGGA